MFVRAARSQAGPRNHPMPRVESSPPLCAQCGCAVTTAATDCLCPVCLFDGLDLPGVTEDEVAETGTEAQRSILPLRGYTVREEIARGGMGIVYRARQWEPEREVALKMLLPLSASSAELRERFQREAQALSELEHTAILPIYGMGEHDGMPWFTMKLATGGNLAERAAGLRGHWTEIARLLAIVADAVQFAHDRGVLHRDLKPGNILFDDAGRPFVADFGLAKLMREDADLTQTRLALGTPTYLAPEVAASSARRATVASDVYSLGAVLFELLAGRPPFQAEGLPALLARIVEDEPRFPEASSAAVPRDLRVIALRCLAKNPAQRYASARDLAEELRRFLAGEPILARPAGAPERAWRWSRRNPALAVSLAACVLIAGAGAAAVWRQLRHTEAARAIAVQKTGAEQAQRTRAEAALRRAEESELVMRRNLYAADMLGAQRALEQGDLGGARVLLNAHRPAAGQADLRGFEWRYLWGRSRSGSFLTLPHEDREVSVVAFSPDGKWLTVSCRQLYVYDAVTFRSVEKVDMRSLQSLAFIPGDRGTVMGNRVGMVIRSKKDGAPIWFSSGGRWPNVALSPSGLMAVGVDSNHIGPVDGTTAVYGAFPESSDAAVRMRRDLPESGGVVAFSPDGKMLATGSWKGKVTLWDPETEAPVKVLRDTGFVQRLGFSPDGRALWACTLDNGMWWHDLSNDRRTPVAVGHAGRVLGAAVSPDGQTLATGGADQTVRLWDIRTGRERSVLRGHSYSVTQLAWSTDGKILASAGLEGTVHLWRVDERTEEERPIAGSVSRRLFSPDGRFVVVTHPASGVALYEFPSMKLVGGPRLTGQPLRFSSGGDTLVTFQQAAGASAELVRWSVPDLQPRGATTLRESTHRIVVPTLSPDGRWFAAGTGGGQATLWELSAGGKVTRHQIDRPGWIMAMEFSPDSGRLVASFMDSTAVHTWDLAHEPVKGELGEHKAFIGHFAFSSDGRTLISADGDKFIKVWDVVARKEVGVLLGHREGIGSMDLSPDGRTVASTSSDQTLRLWNVATRREVARFEVPALSRGISFSPDGSALVVSTQKDGAPSVEIWRAPSWAETDADLERNGVGR
jgi:WD40 repeat protein